MNKTIKDIEKYLEENKFYCESIGKGDVFGTVDILVRGDWHHDHLCLRWLMEEFGFTEVQCKEVGHSDSDWYTAVHTFGETEFVEAMRKLFA